MGCCIGRCCRCLVFPAPSGEEAEAEWEAFRRDQAANLVWLTTRSGDECPALYVRPPSGSPRLTVLFSHGNAEDITLGYGRFETLAREFNVAFLLYEYSGYSLSSGGGPSEAAFYQNIEAAFAHLTQTLKIPRGQIVLWGRSIGSGPTVQCAPSLPTPNHPPTHHTHTTATRTARDAEELHAVLRQPGGEGAWAGGDAAGVGAGLSLPLARLRRLRLLHALLLRPLRLFQQPVQ